MYKIMIEKTVLLEKNQGLSFIPNTTLIDVIVRDFSGDKYKEADLDILISNILVEKKHLSYEDGYYNIKGIAVKVARRRSEEYNVPIKYKVPRNCAVYIWRDS